MIGEPLPDPNSQSPDDDVDSVGNVASGRTIVWRALRAPLVVCGVGFGGFFDGIVFHQILQTHHMLSNAGNDRIGLDTPSTSTVAGLEINTLWDGLFHAFAYLALLTGAVWFWRRWKQLPAVRPPSRFLVAGIVAGWGLFNVAEGLVDHHLLAIHHVVDGDNALLFDLLFLASGAAMLVGGARSMSTVEVASGPDDT